MEILMQLGTYSKHLEILNLIPLLKSSILNLINTAFHILAVKQFENCSKLTKWSGENSFFSTTLTVSATLQENKISQA